MRSRSKLDFDDVYQVNRQASILVSEHTTVIVTSAAAASSEIKALVSLPRLSSILTIGSRYVSMHLFRNQNMSLIVIKAILLSEERSESDSFVSCFTSECKVAPCCKIKSQWNLHTRRISLHASNYTFQSALVTKFWSAYLNTFCGYFEIGVNSSVFRQFLFAVFCKPISSSVRSYFDP